MKCPICNGELVQKTGKISLGVNKEDYLVMKCNKCGEELVSEDVVKKIMSKVSEHKKRMHFRKRISYAGNSLVIRIPKSLAEAYDLKNGSEIDIIGTDKGFSIGLN